MIVRLHQEIVDHLESQSHQQARPLQLAEKKSLIITVDHLQNRFTRQSKVDSYVKLIILLNHHEEYNVHKLMPKLGN